MCPCLHPDFTETFVKVVGERGRNKCILRKTAVRFSGPVAFEYIYGWKKFTYRSCSGMSWLSEYVSSTAEHK